MCPIGQWENAEPGVTRKILNPGQSLMMMEVHFEPNAEGYQHSHPHEQMSYCLYGKIEFTIDGVKTVITRGESIVIPGHAKHGVVALEKSALLDAFTPLREDLLAR
ncbi:cupin domain-containing protein [Paenibacillus dendritiformis]|uniref:cupin domain-containing protein n=1 Tax=Paenibacillus dendritiformis TaxID=130049 RepID=UPI001059CDFE|nr:cupin domain-containing protein [Paenibacillus dendritiformis]TDL53165.1 cupin domain-containing protein [Paenibacillus dendritiformis]